MLGQTFLQPVVTLYKNEGETPLECLNRFRIEQPEYKDAVLSYVGRLDPMAEGILLVLVGEENKNREKYLGLDKVYEVDVLFGVATDTGDVLGKLVQPQDCDARHPSKSLVCHPGASQPGIHVLDSFFAGSRPKVRRDDTLKIRQDDTLILNSFVGPFTQKYPHYSSKPVNGKPLFQWAREGRLSEIEIPEKTSEIYDIKLLKEYSLSGKEILKQVEERIIKVKGDFRQQEIIDSWQENLSDKNQENFSLITIEVSCSSGTYMRTLSEEIGKKLGVPAIAWKIKRLKVANYGL